MLAFPYFICIPELDDHGLLNGLKSYAICLLYLKNGTKKYDVTYLLTQPSPKNPPPTATFKTKWN